MKDRAAEGRTGDKVRVGLSVTEIVEDREGLSVTEIVEDCEGLGKITAFLIKENGGD
jgi:hypothetical protein